MYEFDSDGYLYAEKMLYFLRSFLERCKADSCTHEVVFVLYGRLYYPNLTSKEELLKEAKNIFGNENLDADNLRNFGSF